MSRVVFLYWLVLVSACSGQEVQGQGAGKGVAFHPDPRPMAQTLVYECTGIEFMARIGPGEMALWLPDRYVIVSQVRAASGTKYAEGDVTFWSHGDDVSLAIGAEHYRDCSLDRARAPWEDARRRGVDFRASGNEPGWHLEIKEAQQLLFVGNYGASRLLISSLTRRVEGEVIQYTGRSGSDTIMVTVSDVPCHDSMKGTPFPATVEVQLNGKYYRGCGKALAYPWKPAETAR